MEYTKEQLDRIKQLAKKRIEEMTDQQTIITASNCISILSTPNEALKVKYLEDLNTAVFQSLKP